LKQLSKISPPKRRRKSGYRNARNMLTDQGERRAEEISYGCQLNLFSHAYHNKPDTFAFEGMLRHKLSMTLKITLERW